MNMKGQVNKFVESTVTNQVMAAGNGSQTVFSFSIRIGKPNTISIGYTIGSTPYTGTDNGSGGVTGTYISSGTVDYKTGAVSITFSTAPDNGTNITASYTARGLLDAVLNFVLGTSVTAETLYSGDGSTTAFTGQSANNTPLSKGQVTVNFTIASVDYSATDDGTGVFATHAKISSSTINYSTGAIDITFTNAPDNATNITLDYIYGAEGQDWKLRLSRTARDNSTGEPFGSGYTECIIQNTGYSGQDMVIVGVREYKYVAGNAWGWDLNGYLSWTDGTLWNSNSGTHGRTTYNTTWNRYTNHPNFCLFDDVMDFWIYSNKARIIIVAKVSSGYEACYLGFLKRFGTKADYPYPLFIAGSTDGNYNYASTAVNRGSMIFYYQSSTSSDYYGMWMVSPGNAYKFTKFVKCAPIYWLNFGANTLDKTSNNKALMQQVYIIEKNDGENYGEVDGVFFCSYVGVQAQDVLTEGANSYKVFPNMTQNSLDDFMCILEA